MATAADPYGVLERKVSVRVRDDESHRRLAEAVHEVAVAAIHPARHLGVGRSVSLGMLEDPIESATRAAIETLIAHLDGLVETLPDEAIDQLCNEQVLAEQGIE